MIGGRNEGFLDGACRRPTEQILRRTGLVVGTRSPRTSEGLLSDNRSRRLVVDVEVSGGEPQTMMSLIDGRTVVAITAPVRA